MILEYTNQPTTAAFSYTKDVFLELQFAVAKSRVDNAVQLNTPKHYHIACFPVS